jgi:hypothetical protein
LYVCSLSAINVHKQIMFRTRQNNLLTNTPADLS